MSATENFHYRLPTTAVQFTGTRTVTKPAHGSGSTTWSAEATQLVRADLMGNPLVLAVEEEFFADSEFTLHFSEDGRLTGSSTEFTGQGPKLLGAVAALVGELVPILSIFKSVDDGAFPQQALLDGLTAQEDALAQTLSGLLTDVAADRLPPAAGLDAIQKALTLVSGQLTRLRAERAQWLSDGESVVETHTVVLDIAELPTAEHFENAFDAQTYPRAWEVWDTLHLMATIPHAPDSQTSDDPFQQGAEEQIWYRRPRRSQLTVWTCDKDRSNPSVVRRTDTDILDKRCDHAGLPLAKGGLFSHSSASVTMGDAGTPIVIGNARSSGAGDALAALAGVPKAFAGGINDLQGAITGVTGPKVDPAAAELAQLKAKKDKLQLLGEIAALQK
ncbi:hypothetical protein ABIB25_005483 [Nakamurella sp. UYEF19]|uniref:hypothetical protein n=1 Tax=Nakamurella sp. UYEF19 TaxID=1756392 RepID=UPI003396A924